MTDRLTGVETVDDLSAGGDGSGTPVVLEAGVLVVPQNRGGNGRFLPGNNANPGGRPKGLAALIRQQTGDGAELVTFALNVLRSRRQDPRLRIQAMEWLADRGFGKAIQSHELMGEGGGAVVFTLRLGERDADRDD